MKNIFFKGAIVAFWLLMTGWLVRYEAFPDKFSEAASGYRALLRRGPLILDSWMQIEFQGAPIGYSHTWIDTNPEKDESIYIIRNQTILNFKIMGQNQGISVSADIMLDDQYRLQKFSAAMSSGPYATRIKGNRNKKGFFDVTIITPAAVSSSEMEIPEDVVIYSPLTEMAMKQLAPGESVRIRTIDPLSLAVADVKVEAVRRENIFFDGRTYETTVLNISYQGMTMSSWIDDNGRTLRAETPLGWVMRASTSREILGRRTYSLGGTDLFASMSVPFRGRIQNPRQCKKLKVRLNGYVFDPEGLESHRQFVTGHSEDTVRIELIAQPEPANIAGFRAPVPPQWHPFLSPSAAIQSDNPAIIRQAEKIVEGSRDSFEAAKLINEWVYRNLVKKSAASLPSALDILQRREGDCNEHTYLFVALARAAGLPARINVGIVFSELDQGHNALQGQTAGEGNREGTFYYHAWPSVFVGEWVEMDPTLGANLVDATYLCLLSGEIGDQLKLLGILGRISVDVVE